MQIDSLTVPQLVAILRAAGSINCTPETVAGNVRGGCPTNLDGTIDLRVYGAYLVSQYGR